MNILLISCCGIGKIPFASGTWGSLAATAFAGLVLAAAGEAGLLFPALIFLAASSAFLFWKGVKDSDRYIAETGAEDPSLIVIDEWVGQMITILIFICGIWFTGNINGSFTTEAFTENHGLEAWLVGGFILGGLFLLFRFFDIAKPSLAGWADRKVPGGMGVMLDDVFAGIFAGLTALCVAWLVSIVV